MSNEKNDRNVQLARINASVRKMEESLELLRKNKENFIVKAPADGLLASFNPTLGQNYNQGDNVGKMDVLDGYKLIAKVDEYYISKLRVGIHYIRSVLASVPLTPRYIIRCQKNSTNNTWGG